MVNSTGITNPGETSSWSTTCRCTRRSKKLRSMYRVRGAATMELHVGALVAVAPKEIVAGKVHCVWHLYAWLDGAIACLNSLRKRRSKIPGLHVTTIWHSTMDGRRWKASGHVTASTRYILPMQSLYKERNARNSYWKLSTTCSIALPVVASSLKTWNVYSREIILHPHAMPSA